MKLKKEFSNFLGCVLTGALICVSVIGCGREQPLVTDPGENAAQVTSVEETKSDSAGEKQESSIEEKAPETSAVEDILAGMTTRQKVEQMLVVSYRIWKEIPQADSTDVNMTVENTDSEIPQVNVTELNDTIRQNIKDHNYGGTVLFAQNYVDAEQTLKLISDMQKTSVESGAIPMIIATDQEGGNVSRITFGTSGIGNMALAATGDPDNARKMAQVYGEELSLLNINCDFAPVVDVNNNPSNPVIGVRAFSDDPETVSEYGIAYMNGLKDSGTIATLKHFPGHGNTDTDSHTGFPSIQSTYDELKECELIPFQRLIDAGVDMVMTAHIQYPKIETGTYKSIATGEEVYLPATMSHTILTDILRKDMGFEGVIITDALDMASITDNFDLKDVVKYSINAGNDMLMLPIITDTDVYEKTKEMTEDAVSMAESGEIDMEMVDASVRRILTLKEKYGILDKTDFEVTKEKIDAAEEGVGGEEKNKAAMEMAAEAITLLKNDDNSFPIKMKEGEKTLLLFADSCASRAGTGDMVEEHMIKNNLLPEGADITVLVNTRDNEQECIDAAGDADHVILICRTYGADCLDPATDDGFSTAVFDKVIKKCHEDGKKVVFISSQLPYDAARFDEADAILLSYNSSAMSEIPPKEGAGSAFIPNLPVAIGAALGFEEVSGELPVDVPALDESYNFTDEILYEQQTN